MTEPRAEIVAVSNDVAVADNRTVNGSRAQLFGQDEARDLRSKWEKIQTGFVDEPRESVKNADALVADAVKRLSDMFTDERSKLEKEWDRGDEVSTEDLRLALRRYRSFFDRLLSV